MDSFTQNDSLLASTYVEVEEASLNGTSALGLETIASGATQLDFEVCFNHRLC